jgi:DNA methylase
MWKVHPIEREKGTEMPNSDGMLTVADLIAELQKLDPNDIVSVNNGGNLTSNCPVEDLFKPFDPPPSNAKRRYTPAPALTPYFKSGGVTLYHSTWQQIVTTLQAGDVDVIITHPPFGDAMKWFARQAEFMRLFSHGADIRILDLPIHAEFGHPHVNNLDDVIHVVEETTGIIFDPFTGSGTTLVAAKMLGREAIGCEQEERFLRSAVKRLQETHERS